MSLAKTVGTLAESVRSKESADRETARKRYPILLEQKDVDDKSVAELREAMRLLDKGPAEMEQDVATLAQYRQHEAAFKGGRNLGDRHSAAVTAVIDFEAETAKLLAARHDQLTHLVGVREEVASKRQKAEAALKEMIEMRHRHPDLLGQEKELTPADIA
jgi:hypothetical protein